MRGKKGHDVDGKRRTSENDGGEKKQAKRRVEVVDGEGESRITVARRSINCPQVLFSLLRYFIYQQNVSLCVRASGFGLNRAF